MRVTINFKVDEGLLYIAVKSCIYNGLPPNIKNVTNEIKSTVRVKGESCVDFHEYWGDDILHYEYPEEKIDAIVKRLFGRIK